MIPLRDKKVVIIRNQALQHCTKKEVKLYVGNNLTFSCSLIGSAAFKYKVEQQLKSLIRGSYHGKLLLQELAKLPKTADIVEFSSSHATSYKDYIIVLHNPFTPQGFGKVRFEDIKGRRLRGSFHPHMVLAHELFHVGQLQKADFFKPHCNWLCSISTNPWENVDILENATIRYINQIRLEKNAGYIRTHHAAHGGIQADTYKKAQTRVNK